MVSLLVADNGSDAPGPKPRFGLYPNSAVDSFSDPPPTNSRWVGWLIGAFILLLAVMGRSLGVGAAAAAVLLVTAALAVRDRRGRR